MNPNRGRVACSEFRSCGLGLCRQGGVPASALAARISSYEAIMNFQTRYSVFLTQDGVWNNGQSKLLGWREEAAGGD